MQSDTHSNLGKSNDINTDLQEIDSASLMISSSAVSIVPIGQQQAIKSILIHET